MCLLSLLLLLCNESNDGKRFNWNNCLFEYDNNNRLSIVQSQRGRPTATMESLLQINIFTVGKILFQSQSYLSSERHSNYNRTLTTPQSTTLAFHARQNNKNMHSHWTILINEKLFSLHSVPFTHKSHSESFANQTPLLEWITQNVCLCEWE